MTISIPRAGVGRLLLVGAVAGLLSGMLGVGGILSTAAAGTRVNLSHGHIGEATTIGLGGVLSALAGASLALYISGSTLTRLFGAFVAAVGVRMLFPLALSRRVAAR